MDVREKLVEVIRNFNSKIVPYYAQEIADKLIANGVTVCDMPLRFFVQRPPIDEALMKDLLNAPIFINPGKEQIIPIYPEQEWILVKERTPTESDGTVLVCLADVFPYNEKEPYIDAKHDRRITEAFYSQFSKRWYKDGAVFPDGVVTHWMPLPEPPNMEVNKNDR